jgi:hypothetical protein
MNYPSEYAYVTPYRSGYPIHVDYFKPQFFAPQEMPSMASPRSPMDQFYLPQLPSIFYYSPEMVNSSAATPIDYELLEKELGDGKNYRYFFFFFLKDFPLKLIISFGNPLLTKKNV